MTGHIHYVPIRNRKADLTRRILSSGHRWTSNQYGALDDMLENPGGPHQAALAHLGPVCTRCGYHFCTACVVHWNKEFEDTCTQSGSTN